ncbi:MAG: hypothetical protein RL186_397 [Pseudomonadota bacterium]|jgi:hemolysin activation/secretion protein
MRQPKLVYAACLLALPFLGLSNASAQTATPTLPPADSQLPLGETARQASKPAVLDLRLGGQLNAPQGAGAVGLTIQSVQLVGEDIAGLPDMSRLLPTAGTRTSMADMYDLAGKLQQAYLDAGYPLVRVIIPVQDLTSAQAEVRILVVNGFISRVDSMGLPAKVQDLAASYASTLVGQRSLRTPQLERAIMLAGEVAGLTLRPTLTAGTVQGETVLVLTGDFRAVNYVFSVDNRLSDDLGKEQATLSVGLNSPFGRGERVNVTVATALENASLSEDAARRYIGGTLDLPIGNKGLVLGLEASLSTSRPGGDVSFLQLETEYKRVAVSATYPVWRSRNGTMNVRAQLDANEESQTSNLLGFPVTLSRDETRVLRLSGDMGMRLTDTLSMTSDLEFAKGIDGLGARGIEDATDLEPLSRQGADAAFAKAVLGYSITYASEKLPVSARLLLRGQTSFDEPLLRSEQFSVASSDLISGPPGGSLTGDSGYGARLQVEGDLSIRRFGFSPYVFGAGSTVHLVQPTAFERKDTDVSAYGGGVRALVPLPAQTLLSLNLEYSRTEGDRFSTKDKWTVFRMAVRR